MPPDVVHHVWQVRLPPATVHGHVSLTSDSSYAGNHAMLLCWSHERWSGCGMAFLCALLPCRAVPLQCHSRARATCSCIGFVNCEKSVMMNRGFSRHMLPHAVIFACVLFAVRAPSLSLTGAARIVLLCCAVLIAVPPLPEHARAAVLLLYVLPVGTYCMHACGRQFWWIQMHIADVSRRAATARHLQRAGPGHVMAYCRAVAAELAAAAAVPARADTA